MTDGDRGTTSDPFVIAGAGGYACELVIACRAVGREPVGLLDDAEPDVDRLRDTGVELVGRIGDAAVHAGRFLVGIGYPVPRQRVAEEIRAQGLAPAPAVVHPSAVLLGAAEVADGTVVFPNATVSRGARLDAHVLVNYNATIGHDTTIGSGCTIGPGSQIGGECQFGQGVLVGSGAVVLQNLEIGAGAVIGSGAVVVRDVAPGTTVVGVPARVR